MASFTDDVKSAFLPHVKDLGFAIVGEQTSESFGDALVIAQSGDVRLRIVRDRSQIFLDLGSAAEPATWFDSTTVLQHLELGTQPAFGGRDAHVVLPAMAAFLTALWSELSEVFDTRHFAATKGQLVGLERARAEKLWGRS